MSLCRSALTQVCRLLLFLLSVAWCFSAATLVGAGENSSALKASANAQSSETQSSTGRPNVVLILSDDQAWSDYSFMGHPVIQTPNLDKLAARSAVFRRGYTPVPLCRPSLLSIITGRYPHQHGVTGNDPKPDKSLTNLQYAGLKQTLIDRVDTQPTLPRLLGQQGYASFQSGKWWEGNFSRGGFTQGMTRGFPQQGGRHGDDGLQIGRNGMKPVLDFIDQSVSANTPFFLWYAPMLPHTPHDPPERLLKKYQQDGRPIELAKYYAMCEFFDETCGQLLDHLDEKKISENTLVVYVTDNGWIQHTSDMKLGPDWKHGFAPRSKQTVHEGGIRTPIMYSWPGRIEPGDRSELATSLDIAPTILAAVAVAENRSDVSMPETPAAGRNLIPLLTNKTALDRPYLCGESFAHDIADLDQHETSLQYRWCIEGQWKLILSYPCEPDRYSFIHKANEQQPQLFDVVADPVEQRNLAAQHSEIVQRLAEHLHAEWHVEKRPIGL